MVNHQTFDWIFFAIVGIPLVLGLIEIANPNLLERFIREKPVGDREGVMPARPRQLGR